MKFNGFTLFRIGGIDVVVDYSWFIIFFLLIYTMADSVLPQMHQHYSPAQYWTMGIITAVLIFASILVHELAHSLVAVKNGINITSIRLLIFGGLSQSSSEPKNGRQEFLIALAGPAASMVLGFGFFTIYGFTQYRLLPVAVVAFWVGWSNVILALLNLMPGFPLDGGRILRAFLWDHWNDMSRATKVVSQIGNIFAMILIAFGILTSLVSQSIISGLWLIFLGLFMKQSAVGSYQAVLVKRALSGMQIQQIMTVNVVIVDWLLPLDLLVRDYIYKYQFTNFPVFNRDELIGTVSLDEVKTIAKELWSFKQVRDIMTSIEHVTCLRPAEDVGETLTRMVTTGVEWMPVVENNKLMGIVSRRDIMSLFKIKTDLGAA